MQYVDRVRYYRNKMKLLLENAVERAVDECIREGILANFLSKDRAGAVMFSVNEHNEEEEWRKFREAEREYGIEIGREEERGLLLQNLMKNQNMSEEEARKVLGII